MPDTPEEAPAADTPSDDTRSRKMIDVQGMIKQASTRVSVNQLVQQGKKYISLLSKDRIEQLINQSVKNIVDKYRAMAAGVVLPEEQIEAEAKGEFNELLQTYQSSQKAKTQLEQSKELMSSELEDLRKDLEKQKLLAEGKLNEEAEKALIVGFKEFERELEKQVVKVFEKRKIILEETASPEAVQELKGVENAIRPIIAKLVATERERFAMSGGQSREIAMMEKRMEKLYATVAALENALKTITQSKVYSNQQINNLLRQLGLAQDDKHFEKKREMLKFVLDGNKDIRTRSKMMEEKGISLANPTGAAEIEKRKIEASEAVPAAAPAAPQPPPAQT